MPVHAVVLGLAHHVRLFGLVLHFLADLAFGNRVAPELARQHHQRAVQQPALLQIENQLRDRRVDLLLHDLRALMAVLVRVPVAERDVLRRDFDIARARLHQPAREQAALPEAAGVVNVEAPARLEREVERLRGWRREQPVRRIDRADQRLALKIARRAGRRARAKGAARTDGGGSGTAARRVRPAAARRKRRPAGP